MVHKYPAVNIRRRQGGALSCLRLRVTQRGFTMVELVAVMVISGILVATLAPRFFGDNVFQSRGFYDQVISTLRYAQKAAIAQNRFVCVTFTANGIALTYDPIVYNSNTHPVAACPGSSLAGSSGQTTSKVNAPSGVSLSGYADFNFSALGKPSASGVVSVSGYATPITVEAETGYVH